MVIEVYVLIAALLGIAVWLYWHDKKNDNILEELKKDSEEHKAAHATLLKLLGGGKCCDCCKCKKKGCCK